LCTIPAVRVNRLKFWWDQELNELKKTVLSLLIKRGLRQATLMQASLQKAAKKINTVIKIKLDRHRLERK